MAILNVKDIFHDLHQIPEIGFQEFKTSAYLADKLRELGYKVTTNVGGTGVVGVVKGAEPGPVMLLRADMDALPLLLTASIRQYTPVGMMRTALWFWQRLLT